MNCYSNYTIFQYIIRRLLVSLFLLFFISLVSFFLFTLTPGSPYPWGDLNPKISPTVKAEFRKKFHLDRPLLEQYYLIMRDMFSGKLLSNKDDVPVFLKILDVLPYSLILQGLTLLIGFSCGISLAIFLIKQKNAWMDECVSSLSFIFISLPNFWIAYLVILFLVNQLSVPVLGIKSNNIMFSPIGSILDRCWHVLLPATLLAVPLICTISRYLHATMKEQLDQNYMRAALAKGLPESRIIYHHLVPNSLRPIIINFGMLLPNLLGGSVIIETIFSYPGLGRLGYEAVLGRDYPTLIVLNFLVAILVLIGNLIADILVACIDPRVHLE